MHISANMLSHTYAPTYTGTSAHTYKHTKANNLSSHSDLCCLQSACLSLGAHWRAARTLIYFCAHSPSEQCGESPQVVYYQKPFSTQMQVVSFHRMTSEWLLLSLTRPAQHLSSVAFCYLFIRSMVCPSHIPSGDSALPEPSHPWLLRTIVRRQFPSSIFSPRWPFT